MKARDLPPLGTRFEFRSGKTTRRVYELVETLPEGTKSTAARHACDRHTLRVVEESGYTPQYTAGIGFEIHVEDAWFTERTDARRVA